MSKLRIALAISLFLHFTVIAAILISGRFSLPKVTPAAFNPEPIIEAKVIDESQLQKQRQKVIDEQNRIQELKRKAAQAQKKREAEAAKLKAQKEKQEIDKKKAEQAAVAAREKQKKEKAKAKAKAKQLEDERKRKELEKKKAEERAKQAKEKREREQQALKEAERKRQAAAERAEQEKLLNEQLQAEQAARQQKRNKQVLSEVQKYEALIRQTINRNFIKDNAMQGLSCRFNIRLASNGLVIQVKELGGDPLVCRAGKAAILKAVELPVSNEPDVYEKLRDITFTFAPEI